MFNRKSDGYDQTLLRGALCVNIDIASIKDGNYRIFLSSEVRCAEKVLPPDARSIVEVSRETGNNDQTIRNWVKKSESGILPDGSHESSFRVLTPKEKCQLGNLVSCQDNSVV